MIDKKFKLKPVTIRLTPTHLITFNPTTAEWSAQVKQQPVNSSGNLRTSTSNTSGSNLHSSVGTVNMGLPLNSGIDPPGPDPAQVAQQIKQIEKKKAELVEQIKKFEQEKKQWQGEVEKLRKTKEAGLKELVVERCRKGRLQREVVIYTAGESKANK